MENKIFVALAYIRESDHPYRVFSNLILHCLTLEPTKELRHDQLRERMSEMFGLLVPNHLVTNCVKPLIRKGQVMKLNNGGGYKLIKSDFVSEKFLSDRTKFSEEEETVLLDLIRFLSEEYNITWKLEDARKNLTYFILNQDVAAIINLDDSKAIPEAHSYRFVDPSWYIKKYIQYLLQKKEHNYQYLKNIIEGYMVYIGITQVNDYDQEINQKYRGTAFYIDTKFLLRILGYSMPYHTECAQELISIIVNEYKGKIFVFEHVLQEAEHAIRCAERDMASKGSVVNDELEAFRVNNNYVTDDFRIEGNSLRNKITNVHGFQIDNKTDWNKSDTRNNNLDWEDLQLFIEKENPTWNSDAINNDVISINRINVLRNSDYSINYGGQKKLPIMITTNYQLVYTLQKYTGHLTDTANSRALWTKAYLPLISDYFLMCRLWLPNLNKNDAIVDLSLLRISHSLQQSDTDFYDRFRKTAKEVAEKHSYNLVDLDEERYEKLQEIAIAKTGGDLDGVNENVLTTSFEELASRESGAKDNKIHELEAMNSDTLIQNIEQREMLVKTVAKGYLNKIGIKNQIATFLIENSSYLALLFVDVLGFSASCILTEIPALPILLLWGGLYAIGNLLLKKVMQKIVSKTFFHRKNVYCKVVENYKNKIRNTLNQDEKKYEEEIIEYCIRNSNYFIKRKDTIILC